MTNKALGSALKPFWKKYTESFIRNSHVIVFHVYYGINDIPWILL